MQSTTGAIPLSGGLEGAFTRFEVESPKAVVVVAHGLGEHGGRYLHVARYLTAKGYLVYTMDHRGHGLSGGPRGHVMSFDQYAADLLSHIQNAREGHSDLPWFLLGHSMGALISLYYCQSHPQNLPKALMVTSPLLGVTVEVPKVKAMAGTLMSRVWPTLSLSNELDPSKVCRDPAVVEAYTADPLVHDKVSARWFTSMQDAMAAVHASAKSLTLPILLQAAGADALVSAEQSRVLFNNLAAPDKKGIFYEGWYHEILNEPEQHKPLDEIADWIATHLTS